MTQLQQLLIEMRRRSKLKGDFQFISYRELECEPFYMNSPTSQMSRLEKKHFFVYGGRIGSKGVAYKVMKIRTDGIAKHRAETLKEFLEAGQRREDYITMRERFAKNLGET